MNGNNRGLEDGEISLGFNWILNIEIEDNMEGQQMLQHHRFLISDSRTVVSSRPGQSSPHYTVVECEFLEDN